MPYTPDADHRTVPKASGRLPSQAQIKYLRTLAAQTGTSFAYPKTSREASGEIARLKALAAGCDRQLERDEARRETHDVRDVLAELPGQRAAPRDGEIAGYGSSAHWT
jgi:hypothetical protein